MYLKPVEEFNIDLENQTFNDKPLAFEKQVGFPYHDLQPRDFERLTFCLYRQEILNKQTKSNQYDEIQLMQGVGERGRDCVLLKNGVSVGVIQCKRYKNNIDRSQVGKEIIKFILHYTHDNKLIANLDCFTYTIAVSYGFSEKALDLINSLANNTYNKDEIESWAKGIIDNTKGLKSVVFDNVKDTVYDALDKIDFYKLIPDDLNLMIEKYSVIKTMFFDLKSTIDVNSFERLLIDREKEKVELLYKSSSLERALQDKNEYLYGKLQETKKIVANMINKFSANFILYTHHTKKHTENVTEVLGQKLLDSNDLFSLNEIELYVLSAASYLHDIGICIPNEEIDKKYKEYRENNKVYNFLELDEYIREQHPYLTYEFILSNSEELHIVDKWKIAIALVAGLNRNTDVFEYKYFEYAPDGGRNKVCIPYLNSLIQLADMIDIENINANYLLRHYTDMEDYRLSKKLWEEANYSITSMITDEVRLIFEGKCDDQLVYISLNRHIQELKQRFEQLNSKVRKYRYPYKFSISFIEENLNTPFCKKLGFTLDYNGIAETLIGKNIYNNEFDALREVIQNSIDSCILKRIKYKEYTPNIEVQLTDTDIIIRDNGLGMDEYIIENYFANLCKSYYKDYGLDSIGQFGIGVFSYFMLCNSFTVETKTKEGNTIKFKAYRNLRSYFYFYEDNLSQINEGTIISLHLEENILKELSFNTLITKIRDYFKFVDIPIIVKYGDKSEIVEKEKFNLDIEMELIDKFKYTERNKIKQLKFLESYIDNDDFEGVYGLVFKNSSSCTYQPIDLDTLVDGYSPNKGSILLCQKGISITQDPYVFMRLDSFFKSIVCKINIKKDLNLELSRNNFKDTNLNNIIYQFEKDLLDKFFKSIQKLEPKQAYILNSQFYDYYLVDYKFPYKILRKFILDNFYVQVYTKNKTKYMLLSEFIYNNEQFILLGGLHTTKQKVNSISSNTDIPLVYIENYDFCSFYFEFFTEMNYGFSLCDDDDESILIINRTNQMQNKYKISYHVAIPFNNGLLFNRIETIGHGITLYNLNHPLIQLFVTNSEQINENMTLFNKFKQFFNLISDVYTSFSATTISLLETNDFLDEITRTFNTNIKITLEDFPERFREMVLE